MKKASFMKGVLALAIMVCGTLTFVSCVEEEIAPKQGLLGAPLLDDGSGTNDNADGDTGNDNDDLIDVDTNTGDGNDNADGEKGNDNDDVIDIDLSTSDGNDNADGEKGNDNDDVIDADLGL